VCSSDLIEKVVCSKKEAKLALTAVTDAIKKALKKGQRVTIPGFGSFRVVKRAARKGRNPRTGEPVKIKASKKAKFTAGKGLKDILK
jgi:nucleoid DNA-binding protein